MRLGTARGRWTRSRARGYHGSRGERMLFVAALVVFGLASMFSSLALLARVTPALFPSHTLGGAFPILEKVSPISLSETDSGSAFNKRINLLIIGLDKRPQYRELAPYRTDTLMVATVDPLAKTMSLLGIPRDLHINIHHPRGFVYQDRINTSYGVGFNIDRSIESGARQLQKDLLENFGIETDYWVIMDFKGVEKLVNAVGGVDLDIPKDLAVPFHWYSDDDQVEGTLGLTFPPGPQHLDGYNAVAFGRYRETDDDFHRIRRQQMVVIAALSRVFSRGLLNNPFGLWDAYNSTVKTNINRGSLPGMAVLLKQTNARMTTYSLADPVNGSPTVFDAVSPGGGAVLGWHRDNVQHILAQVFTKASYSRSNVEIQDGYGGPNGGTYVAALGRYLKFQGLPEVYQGHDVNARARTEIVLLDEDRREMAEDIAGWMEIPVANIQLRKKAQPSEPDILIVIGQDFKLPGG